MARKKKYDEQGMQQIERMFKGRTNADILDMAIIIRDFKTTAAYKLLLMTNEADIKRLLSENQNPGETSDHRLGVCEGIQQSFENRVEQFLADGDKVKRDIEIEKARKELEQEEREPEIPDQGDDA